MTNEDFKIEELENETSNKSQKAKRIAATAGIIAAGGVGGYAATTMLNSGESETIDESDLDSVNAGANQIEPEKPTQPAPRAPQPEPTAPGESEDNTGDITIDKTTHYYGQDGELIATQETGTYLGRQFELTDVDGDKQADYFGYDYNGDGAVDLSETERLTSGNQIAMGHATSEHEDVFLKDNNPIDPYYSGETDDPWGSDNNGDPFGDKPDPFEDPIDNDFADEKTGEDYGGDYAENNDDYNNNADILDANENEMAYEEEIHNDFESSDLADNSDIDDSFDDIS